MSWSSVSQWRAACAAWSGDLCEQRPGDLIEGPVSHRLQHRALPGHPGVKRFVAFQLQALEKGAAPGVGVTLSEPLHIKEVFRCQADLYRGALGDQAISAGTEFLPQLRKRVAQRRPPDVRR